MLGRPPFWGSSAYIGRGASILESLLDDDDISRVVLSHDNFMGVPGRSVENNMLYPVVGQRTPRLRALFDGHDVEIFMAMRDPASFIPAVFDRTNAPDFATFLEGSDPMELRWSNVIQRQRAAAPDVPITTWCNEDTPLIWHEILREMSGHDRYTVLDGRDDFLGELMVKGGWRRRSTCPAGRRTTWPGLARFMMMIWTLSGKFRASRC